MSKEALKLELIKWLSELDDSETIEYLRIVKESCTTDDWWNDLTEEQKQSIDRGIEDIENGRVTSHEDVVKKYGL